MDSLERTVCVYMEPWWKGIRNDFREATATTRLSKEDCKGKQGPPFSREKDYSQVESI